MTAAAAPWSAFTSVERLLELHAESLARFKGRAGGPREGCLEGSLGAAASAEVYLASDEGTPGLTFASYLLFYLANNHCFTDGNKRVAWLAAVEILAAFGLTIEVDDGAAYEFMDQVAKGLLDQDDVRTWITRYVASVDPESR